MRTNMWARIISAVTTLIAFIGAVFFYYCGKEFCWNVCLAVFGSALLTYINAFVSYRVAKRDAFMQYLSDLRRYRKKYRHIQAAGRNAYEGYVEDISDFFYEVHNNYSKIQHLCKNCCIHRSFSSILDRSFQKIKGVQSDLEHNYLNINFAQYRVEIDESIEEVESLARKNKYLDARKKEDTTDGQT